VGRRRSSSWEGGLVKMAVLMNTRNQLYSIPMISEALSIGGYAGPTSWEVM
jgi:hypothetical protein